MKQIWYSQKGGKNSPDTIHQVLMYGSLDEITSLKKELGVAKIKEFFLKYPKKIYTSEAFFFIKNFILNIDSFLDEQQYLKNTPRHTR